MDSVLNRLHVAKPAPRDEKARPPCIPENILRKKELAASKTERKRKLEREIEEEMGDDYVLDLKKNYDIEGDQKFDIIPEFWEGHNVADYIDPDIFEVSNETERAIERTVSTVTLILFLIFQKLNALEQEENLREEAGVYDSKIPELSETMLEIRDLARQIRERKAIMKDEARITKASTKPVIPRTAGAKTRDRSVSKLRDQMEDLGVDMEGTENVSLVK